MSRLASFALLVTLFAATGCSTRLVDFTMISTKNVDWSKAATFTRGDSRVVGDDLVHTIVIIPTGISTMKEAIDRAIEATPGAVALVDGVVYQKAYYIPLIYGQSGYVVEGTPLISPAFTDVSTPASPTHAAVYLDGSGNVKERRALSADEYAKLKEKVMPMRK